MAKHKKTKDDIFVESTLLSPEDEGLNNLFDEMERTSLKTLEDAARQIITLSTTLLGAFFGLLAFKDAPSYLSYIEIKIIGTLALISFMAALIFSLRTISPQQYTYSQANLSAKRKILEELFKHKHGMVTRASRVFGSGVFLMLVVALIVLFRI